MFEGLKNLGNLGSMLKQAQEMGARFKAVQEELRQKRTQGSAGAGMVIVEMNGLCETISCRVDPSLLKPEDREMLEDLLVAAVNQAMTKARDLHSEAVKSAAGGIPGIGDLLGQIDGN